LCLGDGLYFLKSQATDVIELLHVLSFVGFRGCCKLLITACTFELLDHKNAYSAYGFCTNADPSLTMWSVVKLGMHVLMPTGYGFALYASVYGTERVRTGIKAVSVIIHQSFALCCIT
jgi:ABC-type amino acid transport system permease subunit